MTSEQNIVRLDIAVNYSVLMRVGERTQNVTKDLCCFVYRQLTRPGKPRAKRLAFDERHRVVRESVTDSRREHWDDVRVLQLRGKLNLAAESLDVHGRGEVGRKYLYYDFASERQLLGNKHPRHSAAAQLALEGVVTAEGLLEAVLEVGQEISVWGALT